MLATIGIAALGAGILTAIVYALDIIKRAAHGDTEL